MRQSQLSQVRPRAADFRNDDTEAVELCARMDTWSFADRVEIKLWGSWGVEDRWMIRLLSIFWDPTFDDEHEVCEIRSEIAKTVAAFCTCNYRYCK